MKKTILLLTAVCLVFTPFLLASEKYKPVTGKIMTKWAKDVSPDNVWQDYPRPQLVRKDWKNLNGLWDYALLAQNSQAPANYQGRILVPFCVESALSGVGKSVSANDRIWYHRTFEVPSGWKGKRVMLNFEAVDWRSAVWVNDVFVGSHKGGYDRFSFDITRALKENGLQKIVVCVDDPSSFGTQARGKQQISQGGIWYTPVSGIWQTVWLEALPAQRYIKEIKIIPDIDKNSVTIIPMLDKPSDLDYRVDIAVLDGDMQLAQAQAKANKPVEIKINNPKLWSPDEPFLYGLKLDLTLNENDKEPQRIDQITSYFGMRKISLADGPAGNKIMHLNNKPLFHYGTLDQGWWPDGLYSPPSDEAMKYDIEITKKMGFNMIRKHIKVEPARWYYWCDKLGIMVWQDMPSAMIVPNGRYIQQIGGNDPDLIKSTKDTAQFELEMRQMIDQHFNAPSIVMWVPFNEGWGQYDTIRICSWIKQYDPTRLVNPASGWALRPCGDIYDIHSYSKTVQVPKMFHDRASVVGEYGGIGLPIKEHLWNPDMKNWGYQTYQGKEELLKNYTHKFNQIVEMKKNGLSGAVYTQTTDVESEVNGLMTYDRKVIKIEPEKLNEIHSVLYENN